uniref:T9SS type A sorting domain-containing protein n=1 Tax=Roseihalotalea indica TaxID=2867963 RepID=A0AA49GL13_9BACT|nr:T9SS type A sorting domain-containing protein [Tunicatimonas sp. TK19036]
MNRIALSLIFVLSYFLCQPAQAQQPGLRLVPLGSSPPTTSQQARVTNAQALDTVLALPFWDDFSQPTITKVGYPIPDTLKWLPNSQNTRISTGLAVNPPSVGVASFDGTRLDGSPYSASENDDASDSLVSRPINLAAVAENERNSVYFSFFWQQSGNGEFPDSGDSLRLQFLTSQDQWRTVWLRDGGDSLSTDEFTQEIIQIFEPRYFHDQFRFRFQSFSRLTGAFDTWNVDYVYLNKNRSSANTAYLDRALTTKPTSLFGEYTAVPMEQFRADPARYLGVSSVDFYNLNIELQPVRFTALARDTVTNQTIILNDSTALSPVPVGLERRTIMANPLDVNQINLNAESLYLETEFRIIAGDTIANQTIDYRVNDTVRSVFTLDESFAYDDGEAEFGVEINQQGGKVAYQFVAPEKGLLTHIDIHFPSLNQNQRTPIQLLVWRDIEDSTGQELVLRSLNASATPDPAYNGFTSYELALDSIPFYVNVQDTFYIGYEQQSEQFVAIGFDKNTDASSHTFFNVSGGWQQNQELKGSLMIRPRFDRDLVDFLLDAPTDPVEPVKDVVKIYPNPTDGLFWVEGRFDLVTVIDLFGQILVTKQSVPGKTSLDMSSFPRGMYLVKVQKEGNITTHKILVR